MQSTNCVCLLLALTLAVVAANSMTFLDLPARGLGLARVKWEDEPPIDVCNDTKAEKILARSRNLDISPVSADWLSKDSRVSILLKNCYGVLSLPTGDIKRSLIDSNGKLTEIGNAVSLRLKKVKTNGVPHFSGTVSAFTFGSPVNSGNMQVRTTIRIDCEVAYCLVAGDASKQEVCPNGYDEEIPFTH